MKGIYILTSPSGKSYVGKDSYLPKRANCHLAGNVPSCRLIHRAVKKYSRDAFSVDFIPYPNISDQLLSIFERSHIAELNTKKPNGYNLTDGGDGGINPSDETRRKRSDALKGEKGYWYGKTMSAEHREKLSAARKGKPFSIEHRRRLSESHRGSKNSNYGKPTWNKGKPRSAETKRKISETLKARYKNGNDAE